MSEENLTGFDLKSSNSLFKSFRYAAAGLASAFEERNFKVDMLMAVVALALCAVLQVPLWGWVAVVLCIGGVLAAECMNTAVEAVVDLASPELHPLAKRAKDCAAGTALIMSVTSVVVAAIVYISALYTMLFQA